MSESLWWSMPGPHRFLDGILESLREGRSVAVWFPVHHPFGFLPALERADELSGMSRWHRSQVDATESSPLRALHEQFAPLESGVTPTMRTLAGSEGFRNLLILAAADTTEQRSRWSEFLNEYRYSAKAIDQYQRAVLCIAFVGGEQGELPPSDITLSIEPWWGRTDSLDMRLFASHLLPSDSRSPLLRATAVDVIASLACADPSLAGDLANLSLNNLFDPMQLLQRHAGQCGWTGDSDRHEAVKTGALVAIEGHEVWHSSALAIQGKGDRIQRRVWRGQVSQLFPFLEDRRSELIDEGRSFLPTPPFQTEYDTVDDVHQLEVGELAYFLRKERAPSRLCRRANQLREARNALAHLSPLSASQAEVIAGMTPRSDSVM